MIKGASHHPTNKLTKPRKTTMPKQPDHTAQAAANFGALVAAIAKVHADSAAAASRAVNTSLTLRNWLIGAYIHHYELHGADRAQYGERLLATLALRLGQENLPRMQERELRRFLAFYLAYPQIREAVSAESGLLAPIRETVPPELAASVAPSQPILPTVPVQKLLAQMSFSHFAELLTLTDLLQRAFYEFEDRKHVV